MLNEPFIVIAAFVLDLIIGEPQRLIHPVVLMGKMISFGESLFNRGGRKLRRALGVLLVLVVVILSSLIPLLILWLLVGVSWHLAIAVNIFLGSLTIAAKGLRQAALDVWHPLQKGDLFESRYSLSKIVGRDTEHLNQPEIIKATIESVAENCSDGIIAPLFYMAIGGIPLAYAYKAINTLDSMLGYKNKRYIDFGWGAAKLDDLANFIPSRLTAVLIALASILLGKPWKNSFHILIRDGKRHPSPNAGYPEAAMAGALGIQLGGPSLYDGEINLKPVIGESLKPVQLKQIMESIQLITAASAIFLTLYLVIALSW